MVIAGLFLGGAPTSARGQSISLQPVADTTLIETAPNNNLGGAGFANSGTTQNFTRNRALFRFDVAGTLPPGSTISGVDLFLEVTRQPIDGYAPSEFTLNRMLVSWGEGVKVSADPRSPGQGAPAGMGEATWNDRFAGMGMPWSVAGGAVGVDFSATASASQTIYGVGNSPYTFGSSAQMIADIQEWLVHPESNFGWMLMTREESTNFTARRFGSREDLVNAPTLVIQFTPAPEPGTLTLGLAGLVMLGLRMRRGAL
jgi:hypothetical protein